MDLQHFEGAVCLASFGQLWSGSPCQVTESSNIAVPLQALVSSRKLLWCDFSLNQCCRSTDLWLLRPYGAHNLHPELRYSSNHWMTKYLAINPSDDNTWCAIMSIPSSLLAFFHTGKTCLGSMVHLEFFLTTLCSVSSGSIGSWTKIPHHLCTMAAKSPSCKHTARSFTGMQPMELWASLTSTGSYTFLVQLFFPRTTSLQQIIVTQWKSCNRILSSQSFTRPV